MLPRSAVALLVLALVAVASPHTGAAASFAREGTPDAYRSGWRVTRVALRSSDERGPSVAADAHAFALAPELDTDLDPEDCAERADAAPCPLARYRLVVWQVARPSHRTRAAPPPAPRVTAERPRARIVRLHRARVFAPDDAPPSAAG